MARFSSGSAFKLRGRKSYGLRGLKGKPFHPPLTDFPVAAIVIAAVFDVIAFVGRGHAGAERWFYAAGYVFLAGVIVGLLALLTGFMDWRDTEKGTQIRRMANAHGLAMLTVAALVLVNLGIRFLAQTEDETTVALLILSL